MLPPEKTPALPSPDTALPTTNTTELGAPALIAPPAAKIKNDVRKMAFIGNTV